MERWEAVPNTNGKILVSDQGRIKSLLRGERILKTQPDAKGYLRLRVTIDREKMSFKVHRLVAQAFIPNSDNKPQVNHKDGNKRNNAVTNLEWVNCLENAHHAISNGLWEKNFAASKAENLRRRKSVIAENIATGEIIEFASISAAEKELGTRHITDVLKGKRSQAKGYSFRYKEGGDAICQL